MVRTPAQPTTKNFAETLKDISNTFQAVAKNLKIVSKELKADKRHYNHGDLETQRRVLQNNFDTIRYCSPLLKNLTHLKISLGSARSSLKFSAN